jgi:hypothetical protein
MWTSLHHAHPAFLWQMMQLVGGLPDEFAFQLRPAATRMTGDRCRLGGRDDQS